MYGGKGRQRRSNDGAAYEMNLAQLWTLITLFGLFLISEIGLSVAGYRRHNDEQRQHRQPEMSYTQYLTSAPFFEATMEIGKVNFYRCVLT